MPTLDDEVAAMLATTPEKTKYVLPAWCLLEGVRARPMTKADVESVGQGTTTGIRLVDCQGQPETAAKCRAEIAKAIVRMDTAGVSRIVTKDTVTAKDKAELLRCIHLEVGKAVTNLLQAATKSDTANPSGGTNGAQNVLIATSEDERSFMDHTFGAEEMKAKARGRKLRPRSASADSLHALCAADGGGQGHVQHAPAHARAAEAKRDETHHVRRQDGGRVAGPGPCHSGDDAAQADGQGLHALQASADGGVHRFGGGEGASRPP